jgi:tetratricopeptide (TPR) repeat protein
MKFLARVGVLVLILLFIAAGFGFGQNTVKQIYNKGMEYAVQGKFNEAKEEFEKALKVDTFKAPILSRDGHIIISKSSLKRAIKVIEDLTGKRIEKKTAIHIFKGKVHSDKGQFDRAIEDYNKVLEINPRDAVAYVNRGVAYYDKGQYDQAISDYNKAIEINPRDVYAYGNRGNVYYNKGQYDKAIADYNKVIEINPRDADAYYNRGIAHEAKSQYDKACSDWKQACELGYCNNWGIMNKIRCLGK